MPCTGHSNTEDLLVLPFSQPARPVKAFSVYGLPVAGSVRLRHRYLRSLVAPRVDIVVRWRQAERVNLHTHAADHQLQFAQASAAAGARECRALVPAA